MVPHTTETLTLEEVMEILPLNQSSINNLSINGELKRIKFGKRYLYERKYVYLVLQKLNDYRSISEVTEILKDNGIEDKFKNFTEKGGVRKCKYFRYTDKCSHASTWPPIRINTWPVEKVKNILALL